MRDALIPVLLAALVLPALTIGASGALAQTAPALAAAGTDAAQVAAFLKSLQAAVSLGNRTKVATLVHFPLTAWIDGEETTVRTESEFQARYSRILDADTRKAIAAATVNSLVADAQGIALDGGRIRFRPLAEHGNAIKIVNVGDPNRTK